MPHSNCLRYDKDSSTRASTINIHKIPLLLDPAPPWRGIAVKNAQINELSLHDYKGKYLVLLFYPCDFTFVCPTELIQFSDSFQEFQNLGAEVVAVSTDSQYSHFAWSTTPRKQGGLGEVNMPLLSDKNHKISKDYGILDESTGTPLRALFVIDKKQILRHVTVNEPAIPRSVDEILRVIQACQFVDKYGDICPMGPKQASRLSTESNDRTDFFSPR